MQRIMQHDGTPEHYAQTFGFPEGDAIIGSDQVEALKERFLGL